MLSILERGISGFLPLPSPIFKSPSEPFSSNLFLHRITVGRETERVFAIAWFALPCEAKRIIRALWAMPWGVEGEWTHCARIVCSCTESVSGAAETHMN